MSDQVESPIIKYGKGSYFVPADRDPWPHEIMSAKALAKAGYTVVFLSEKGDKTICDAKMGGQEWEFKSPKTDKLSQIENNLKKATKKTGYIVVDSYRIRNLPDKKIQQYLITRFKDNKSIKRLLYINRKREIIDISVLI